MGSDQRFTWHFEPEIVSRRVKSRSLVALEMTSR
jgi:hypothetical protein